MPGDATFQFAYLLVVEVTGDEDRESAEREADGVVDALETSRQDVRIVSSDSWAS